MIPSLAGRPGARTVLWLLAAAWALAFPLFSTLGPHRTWGWCAAAGYLAAAALTARSPRAAVAAALTGAVALPLAWLVLTGRGQSEVVVVARSGRLLLDTGRLYVEDPAGVDAYTPYLPGMALFGIPQALLGRAGDPRIWCAAAFFAALWGAARLSTASRLRGASLPAWLPVLTASPVVALPLAVSGIDLPLAGLCCLALAAAGAGRPVLTGAALAAACALKWTALPAIAVAAALLAARAGRRTAVHAVLAAAVCTALLVLPAALLQPREMWRQVFLFPTGRADVPTPASSPLPGRLLADLVPGGEGPAA
ncbi:glycosyltransferase 87 family protein, partial [Streptomyces toxytricini]|uniref:glycosyltransferase 87 family protein n=1 Tax=Streptomyces toxytricini TaxID=67369 RepID=UPI0034123537